MAGAEDDINATIAAAKRRTKQRLMIASGAILGVVILGYGAMLMLPEPAPPPAVVEQTEAVSNRCGPNATPEACPERQQFIDAAREFSTAVKPELEKVSLSQWAPDRWQQIISLEQSGNDAFAASRYEPAYQDMQSAIDQGRSQIQAAADTFVDSLAEAKQLFEVGDADGAAAAIGLATIIDPNHAEAQSLAQRVLVLPQVLEYLEAASIARIENRVSEEVQALQAVLQLDPQRQQAAARLAELAQNNRELRFSNAVRDAEQALQRGALAEARRHMQRAQNIGLSRDLSSLATRIAEAEKSQQIKQLLGQAKAHTQSEAWGPALQAYDQALALEPSNARAVEGRSTAQAVITAMQRVNKFVIDPLRVTSPNVQASEASPTNILAELTALQGTSQLLDGLAEQLRQNIQLAEQPVQVRVVSDGKTYVRVQRVGQVGKHKERVITLRPGQYTLEGERPGYHNVLVPLEIPLGASAADVTVVCNEPI